MPSESHLMCRVRLIGRGEPDRGIEGWAGRSHGPKPYPIEVHAGVIEQELQQDLADPLPPMRRVDEDMTDSTDLGVVEVRVDVEAADRTKLAVATDFCENFTRPVESIGAVVPLDDETIHETVSLIASSDQEAIDVRG